MKLYCEGRINNNIIAITRSTDTALSYSEKLTNKEMLFAVSNFLKRAFNENLREFRVIEDNF